jgi:beta-N-acetylhexosaminidase
VDAPYDELPDGPLVVQVRDAHRQPHVVEALSRSVGRDDVVVVEWGWPGPSTTVGPRICARGWSQPGRAAVVDVLRAAGWDR